MKPSEKIRLLNRRGVQIPVPESLEIADEVDLDAISGPDTVLHAGTRLRGSRLLIAPGCRIGEESPATVDNCALAPDVSLKGGYFADSVFLSGASMGSGAHVRSGCLLEEQANGAHTVGLKQTVLLPFVTLGSLINFCDILMAGGTSRRDHSEVGSSFIHFNFTPYGRHGDKATPSLVGDVPLGVMLRAPRIFLGGQAGLVGPLHVDYGTVLAAGFVYRKDHGPNELVIGEPLVPNTRDFCAARYPRVLGRVQKNLRFLGNLAALWHWYERVRLPFGTSGDTWIEQVYRAAQHALEGHFADRVNQLDRLASYMEESIETIQQQETQPATELLAEQTSFLARWPKLKEALGSYRHFDDGTSPELERLAMSLSKSCVSDYLGKVRELDDAAVAAGTAWLAGIVKQTTDLHP